MCGIDLIYLAVAAIIITFLYLICNAIPFFQPFKTIINYMFALIVALFIVLKVLAPLLACAT